MRRALLLPVALTGLASGILTGAALLLLAHAGFGALTGEAGYRLALAGAGWLTGQAVDAALRRHGVAAASGRDRHLLPLGLAAGYAIAVPPLNTLLVEALLTGLWLLPGLVLAAACAALGAGLALVLARRGVATGGPAVAAVAGVLAMAAIVAAVNLLAWWGGRAHAGGDPGGLMLAGVWAIYLVPAIHLPALTHFCLKRVAEM